MWAKNDVFARGNEQSKRNSEWQRRQQAKRAKRSEVDETGRDVL